MPEKPDNAVPRRRWYQFSLRTLLIGVALLGVLCAYVAHEYRIVAARKAWLAAHPGDPRIEPNSLRGWHDGYPKAIREPDRSRSPFLVRRWLGDKDMLNVFVYPQEADEAAALFPEATILIANPSESSN